MAERSLDQQFSDALRALDLTIERAERFRLPPTLGDFILDLGVIGMAVDRYGQSLQTGPFKSSRRQLVERWGRAKDDATKRQIVRDAENLAASAGDILRGGAGATTVAEEVRREWRETIESALPSDETKKWIKVGVLAVAFGGAAYAIAAASRRRADDERRR